MTTAPEPRLQPGLTGWHLATPVMFNLWGEGVSELRIHSGPGYRAYFVRRGTTVIVLLCGGNKATQTQDIKAAKMLAANLEQ